MLPLGFPCCAVVSKRLSVIVNGLYVLLQLRNGSEIRLASRCRGEVALRRVAVAVGRMAELVGGGARGLAEVLDTGRKESHC